MNIQLPLVVVLAVIVFAIIRFLRLRVWIAVVLVLFGFYLAHTMFAPVINDTTRTGVNAVNNRH